MNESRQCVRNKDEKGKVMITQRENRHILKLTGVEPKLAGMISCDTSGDSTKCNFSVTGKMTTQNISLLPGVLTNSCSLLCAP